MLPTTSKPTAHDFREGNLAKAIERQTAQLPSDTFLWLAMGAILGSLALRLSGKPHNALFVGQWVAPFLLFGIYNKLVKQHGSDRTEKNEL